MCSINTNTGAISYFVRINCNYHFCVVVNIIFVCLRYEQLLQIALDGVNSIQQCCIKRHGIDIDCASLVHCCWRWRDGWLRSLSFRHEHIESAAQFFSLYYRSEGYGRSSDVKQSIEQNSLPWGKLVNIDFNHGMAESAKNNRSFLRSTTFRVLEDWINNHGFGSFRRIHIQKHKALSIDEHSLIH